MSLTWSHAIDPTVGEVWESGDGHRVCELATTEDAAAVLGCLAAAGRSWQTIVGRDTVPLLSVAPGTLLLDISAMGSLVSMSGPGGYVKAQAACTWGQLERSIQEEGYTLGPLPSRLEQTPIITSLGSTGCWRPSPRYGSLRDSFLSVQAALPSGITHSALAPRRAMGPDLARAMMGPGLDVGVLTELTLQIWPRPKHQARCQLSFSRREDGIDAMWRIADAGVRPSAWCLTQNEDAYLLAIELEERYPITGTLARLESSSGQEGIHKAMGQELPAVLGALQGPLYWEETSTTNGAVWDVSGFGQLVENSSSEASADWETLTDQYLGHARSVGVETP